MEQLSHLARFKERYSIVLEGFDPVSAGGFTQVPNFILKNAGVSSNAKVAYALLLSYAWNFDRVFPGQGRMAVDMGTSQSTVARAIAELERIGYLDIERRGQGLTNVYVLHHSVKKRNKQ